MIDPLVTWRTTLNALPHVTDASWATNFAAWVAGRVVSIQPNQSLLNTSTGFVFVFNQALFATQLATLTPTFNALSGITGFATAWETAINTTVFPATLNVSPGAFIPPTSPTTLFSAVTSVILDPASILAAKNKIIELATSPQVLDPNLSDFPVKFREAFLLLTITVVGLDSTVPTPVPLTAPNIPLI